MKGLLGGVMVRAEVFVSIMRTFDTMTKILQINKSQYMLIISINYLIITTNLWLYKISLPARCTREHYKARKRDYDGKP